MASSRSASPDEKVSHGGSDGPNTLVSQHAAVVDQSQADTAARLVAGKNLDINPAEAARVRRCIDKRLMPLMCYLYFIQYADKVTLGSSAVLGILKSAKLDQQQFNWLSTIFYISYLAFQYPQNLALQRFPVGKWMSVNIFVWSIALMSQAACTNFGGLFACRFIMGMCEGAITPGFMLVTSMFYTKREQTSRVGIWFLMNGVAIIVIGLVSFGVLHTKTERFMPWQWLMIIFGLLTFLTSIAYWFLFPDSPVTANFLSPDDRVIAIGRLRSGQSGVENKTFKKYQAYEAFLDPKTWLWAAFAGFANIMNSLSNQRSLIVKQFGFTPLQTTLLGCVDGVVEIISILVGVGLASVPFIGRAYSSIIIYAIAILGAILVNTLSSSDRVGLLFSYWISIPAIVPFATGLAWISLSTAGHTKRICVNAAVMIGYAVGNASAPFMWKAKYQPRNHVPWLVIALGSAISAALLLIIRYILASENKRRDAIVDSAQPEETYIIDVNEKGEQVKVKVDRSFLDLTDGENQEFRYPL